MKKYRILLGVLVCSVFFSFGGLVASAEGNDDTTETAKEIPVNTKITGDISSATDKDYYKFTIDKPGTVKIKFTNDYNANAKHLRSWTFNLYDANDKLLNNGWGAHYRKISGDNKETIISSEYGLKPGDYYIRVTGEYTESKETFVPHLNYYITAIFTETDEWEEEYNGTTKAATEIKLNQTKYGNMSTMQEVDMFKYTLDEPKRISLTFANEYSDKYFNDGWDIRFISTENKTLWSKRVRTDNTETFTTDEFTMPEGTGYITITCSTNEAIGLTYEVTLNAQEVPQQDTNSDSSDATAEMTQLQAFVTRMYSVVLGRTPDEAGLNDWTNRLESGEAQAVDIVSGFFNSDEYKNMAKSNGEIVTDCYNAMLGREPDEGGYNDWVTRLDNGMSVNAILAGFVGSQEFGNLCDSYGIQPGTYNVTEARDQNQGVTAFVARLYTQALGRGYDVDGLNDWSGQINANPSRENVLYVSTTGFLDSQEFVNKNLDNTEYVKVLYRTYLGREYDDDGLADWVGQLERGENTRDGVAAGFAYSQEFNGIMAQYGL